LRTIPGAQFVGTGNAGVVNGSVGGVTAAPYTAPVQDQTNYLSIGAGGKETLTLGSSNNNAFGLYWGSVDTYNTLTFYSGGVMGTQVASFSGGSVELTLAANEDHFNFDSSDYVEITGLGKFDTVVFTSSSNAFELDNISVGAVPEPSTWAMMILGAELNACSAGRTNPILFCRCSHAHHAKCGARIEPAFDLTGAEQHLAINRRSHFIFSWL
jgi:hypothetical protein